MSTARCSGERLWCDDEDAEMCAPASAAEARDSFTYAAWRVVDALRQAGSLTLDDLPLSIPGVAPRARLSFVGPRCQQGASGRV